MSGNGRGPPTEERDPDPRGRPFESTNDNDDDLEQIADAAERIADALERLVELKR